MSGDLKIVNAATPYLAQIANGLPKEYGRALKNMGFWLKGEIQQGIATGAPGGHSYAPFKRIRLNRKRKVKWLRHDGKSYVKSGTALQPNAKPLGRLKQAVRYNYYDDSKRVVIGWISKSAEKLGTMHEKGEEVEVTPKMRRFYWASGLPMPASRKTIFIPKRPTIEPEFDENAPEIPMRMEKRISEYLRGAK